jgi:hypothetical protein
MGVGPVGFSVEQQNLLWAMWRRGDSIREMETISTLSRPNTTTAPGGCSAGPSRPQRSIRSSRRRCLRLRSRSDSGLQSWPHDGRRASAA